MKLTQDLLQQMWFHNQNYITGRYYEWLTNQENLQSRWFLKPLWMTFYQATQNWLKVKKGEKWTRVVHCKFIEKEHKNWKKKVPCIKKYTVFNIDQCEDSKHKEASSQKITTATVVGFTDELVDFQEQESIRYENCWCASDDIPTDDDRPCYCRECAVHGDLMELRR